MRATARRNQLASVAAQRFHQQGYHRVSLEAVAREVGLTGPAVYRHFRNKQGLLAAAISSGLDLVEAALMRTTGGSLDDLVSASADASLDRPDLWVLLQRESRFLDPELHAAVQAQFGRISDGFVSRLQQERPTLGSEDARLLVAAGMSVLSTPWVGSAKLPRAKWRLELTAGALRCLRLDLESAWALPNGGDRRAGPRQEGASARRTQIIDAATELFFQRGYSAVSLDDIGASIGIAGPSILHYFDTKADILAGAFDRATGWLAEDHQRTLAADPRPCLEDLVGSYTEFWLRHRGLVGVYVSDARSLAPEAYLRTTAVIRNIVEDWTTALVAAKPSLKASVASVRVRASLCAVTDLVRLGSFASRIHIVLEIRAIALAVLLR